MPADPPDPGPRRLEVGYDRLAAWVDGFEERHGRASRTLDLGVGTLLLRAPDGACAELAEFLARGEPGDCVSAPLLGVDQPPQRIGLVLVRRGGYAVGVGVGDRLVAHRCGSRYVQSRTAAGGWSQQRYARRRDNQAKALVESVAGHTAALVLDNPLDAVVTGGDGALTTAVLAADRLRRLRALPRRDLPDLANPNLAVLQRALRRARAVRITLTEPG